MVGFRAIVRMPGPLILASASPRRRELLASLGMPFEVVPPRVEETLRDQEPAPDFVMRTAREKGLEVARRLGDVVVLSADTTVTIDGRILGKPGSTDVARQMLKDLSGRMHRVYTAVSLIAPRYGWDQGGVDETRVWFERLEPSDIEWYLASEDVMDKAGAYAIQGGASRFIPRIDGNYSNVVGLSLPLTFDLFERAASAADSGQTKRAAEQPPFGSE